MPKRTRSYKDGLLAEMRDAEAASHYLNAALQDSDEVFLLALRDVAEARQNMSKLAEEADVKRESLYKILSEGGNPRYRNLISILRALGLRMEIIPDTKPPLGGETSEAAQSSDSKVA
jgi:probable addiction module antidote protein